MQVVTTKAVAKCSQNMVDRAHRNFSVDEILRFMVTGVIATLTHAPAGYWLKSSTPKSGLIANVCGFVSAWWISLMVQFYFSFRGHGKGWTAVRRFAIFSAMIFAISHSLTFLSSTIEVLSDDFVLVIGAVLVPTVSFIVYKFSYLQTLRGSVMQSLYAGLVFLYAFIQQQVGLVVLVLAKFEFREGFAAIIERGACFVQGRRQNDVRHYEERTSNYEVAFKRAVDIWHCLLDSSGLRRVVHLQVKSRHLGLQ